MDRIIFNNVLRGFPADEKFMQIVDQNATSITNVCIALFGKTPTIVCGLNVTKMYKQGVTNVTVDDGFLWTGDDLIPVEGNVFSGIDPDIDLYISTTSTTEQCTFFDGNLYDAYYSNKGTVVNAQLNPSTKYPFRLSTIVRANICKSVVSDIEVSRLRGTGGRIKGTLKQTVYSDNRTNLCGMIYFEEFDLPELAQMNRGIKVAVLPSHNTDITQLKTTAETAYPATITTFHQKDGDLVTLFFTHNFVTINNTGVLRVHIPYEKIGDLGLYNAKISCAVAVDFTYNSGK
ncbi:MAG: hypothetical protein ACFNUH_04205 [Bacteroidota bacterium]